MFTVKCSSIDYSLYPPKACNEPAEVVVIFSDARHEPESLKSAGDWRGFCEDHHILEIQESLADGMMEEDFTVLTITKS